MNAPPKRKPISGGSHGIKCISLESAIEGASRDHKLAAVMTPAVKPRAVSRNLRLTVFVRKTAEAPRAVTLQVKSVARSA
jgi:hypothetical protein